MLDELLSLNPASRLANFYFIYREKQRWSSYLKTCDMLLIRPDKRGVSSTSLHHEEVLGSSFGSRPLC